MLSPVYTISSFVLLWMLSIFDMHNKNMHYMRYPFDMVWQMGICNFLICTTIIRTIRDTLRVWIASSDRNLQFYQKWLLNLHAPFWYGLADESLQFLDLHNNNMNCMRCPSGMNCLIRQKSTILPNMATGGISMRIVLAPNETDMMINWIWLLRSGPSLTLMKICGADFSPSLCGSCSLNHV